MQHTDPVTRAVVPPLHVSTTFYREPDNTYPAGYSYAYAPVYRGYYAPRRYYGRRYYRY